MLPRVGFLGVGQMGRPMVDRMVGADVPVETFVRRDDLRADLLAGGVPVVDSVPELAARCDVLIMCLFDDAQVREAILDSGAIEALSAGSVLASHVTGSPDLARELQDAAGPAVAVLDAPISGTAEHIRRGELTILVGGDAAALERAHPAFEAYAHPIIHVGGRGDGQRAKLVNNLLFAVNLRAALDAAELGKRLGMDPADLARILGACSGASFALGLFESADPGTLAVGVRRYLVKDVDAVHEVAAELGIDLGELGALASWVHRGRT